MSQTLLQLAVGVRALLKDFDQPPVVDGPVQIYRALVRNAQVMGEDAKCARTWQTSAFSCVANSLADVTLPAITNSAYQAIEEIRDPTNGRPLTRVSPEEIDWIRRGVVTGTSGQGDPISYALWEDSSSVVTLRWDRVPSRALPYDIAKRAVVPELYTDAAVIDFVAPMLRGVEAAAAVDLFSAMSSDMRQKLGLPPGGPDAVNLLNEWREISKTAVERERFRKGNISGRPYAAGYVVGP